MHCYPWRIQHEARGPMKDLAKKNKLQKHLQEVKVLRRKSRGSSRRPTTYIFLSLSFPSLFLPSSLFMVTRLYSRPTLMLPTKSRLQNHQSLQKSMKSTHQGESYKEAWRRFLEDQLLLSFYLLFLSILSHLGHRPSPWCLRLSS